MQYYVYYNHKTNHDDTDDIAIACAETMEYAKLIFKRYYIKVEDKNIQEVNFNRGDGYDNDIFIISDY